MKITEAIEKYERIKKNDWENGKYLLVCEDAFTLVENNEFLVGVNIPKEWLVNNNWEEYTGKFKTNFERSKMYFTIQRDGKVHEYRDCKCPAEDIFFKNFNYFPNRELAEYINKKQLLERQLMVFSYLNGADKINWNDDSEKYSVDFYISSITDSFDIDRIYPIVCKSLNEICFVTKEVRDKAVELYKKEIEEVLRMSFKFGF
ncbi:TPA: hypothetical protein KNO10_002147 [Clostridioides difficile]|uniref:hypothetical protein n=1 Tax=Clostridioides difficile TaxID=1496 RepID=UPI00038D4C33|nr:hypothetical protein [Clostridioides difficile]EQG38330.1 hypothetical protein QIO_0530 [Clostridioides difficile DA00129]SJQ30818.1 Uncharacterised protein [Clostridioides difficile]SJR41851.1 Uncharacterised protein [Clostridioides difficile]HBF0262870.1 hypothetical protein [Clostridioides difficile]HBF0728995.1 hypothetical protein [Clostridioides difficile]